VSTLLVASTGGHLKELCNLKDRLALAGPLRWVTFDTPQSRSLLADEQVDYVPFVGGRDPLNVTRNLLTAKQILRDAELDTVVSTGSAVALPYFALARVKRLACHFIESAARSDGPSMTGGLIGRIPGVNLYTQYPSWADARWRYGGSVFDAFEPGVPALESAGRVERVLVSLGTYRGYGFQRLVRRLLEILPPEAEVLWQTGDTDVSELGVVGHEAMPEHEFTQAMSEADVVVAHAGVGTALAALEVGKCPVLVPRRMALGEHVDDHQTQIADELGERDLAVVRQADELAYSDLLAAASRSTVALAQAPPFMMSGAALV
jgi:UDP-N-acetylglucosamine transferase subunit ALG13